jgi:hypothetical protein
MADTTKIGNMTVIAAADIADSSHPMNTEQSSQYNDQAGLGKVLGRMYIRDNGSEDYDLVMPIGSGATGKWIVFGRESTVTPS